MSCGNAFDSNMPPFVNTRGTQKAVVSLQAWRPRRFGWECTEREDRASKGGSERWLETVYTSRCSSANPSPPLPLVVQSVSEICEREECVLSPALTQPRNYAGCTFDTFLPGLRLVLTMLDLLRSYGTKA